MPDSGEAKIREIQQDLACPECAYNLRGLHGDVVICPECGTTVDIARLVTLRWTGPWHRAPGLTRLMLPTAWLAVGSLLWLVGLGTWTLSDIHGGLPAAAAAGLCLAAGWGWLMWRAGRMFQQPAEGWGLALLAHVIFVGYLVGILGMLGAIFNLVLAVSLQSYDLVWPVTVILVLSVVLWACRRAERFIGERCIREHLRRSAVPPAACVDPPGAAEPDGL